VVRENNDTPGFVHEIEVTLPEVTCQRCTLQVLQFMYDDRAAPYYFQCADLVIAGAGAVPDAGPVASGAGDSSGSASGINPALQAPAPSGGMAGAAPPGTRPAAESRMEDAASSAAAAPGGRTTVVAPAMSESASASDGGCSLSAGAAGPGAAQRQRSFLGGLLALGLALSCRRWRRSASPIC
jgi:hypothetical protein